MVVGAVVAVVFAWSFCDKQKQKTHDETYRMCVQK